MSVAFPLTEGAIGAPPRREEELGRDSAPDSRSPVPMLAAWAALAAIELGALAWITRRTARGRAASYSSRRPNRRPGRARMRPHDEVIGPAPP